MPKPKERRLADFVRSPASDAQLLDLWSRIEVGEVRRQTRTRRVRRGAAAAAVTGALLGGFLLIRTPEPAAVGTQQARVEQAPSPAETPERQNEPSAPATSVASETPRQLSLADGSELMLSTGARARVLAMGADEVRVRLEGGQVECEVAHDRGRRFVIEAGEFEVVVTGTRFTVNLQSEAAHGSSVAVSVERGSVQIWEAPERLLASLSAGQRWASERPAPREAPAPGSARPAPSAPDASTLLARASAARQAGKLPEAVAALEQLIKRHPKHESAGYAAFLLGRIQLDSLGDARAAVESFSFASAHPGSGFFAEDAEARRVEAFARAGQMTECAEARDQFLAKYPRAARAASIQKICHER